VGENHAVSGPDFLETAARQARLALDAARRPWPLPDAPWSQAETRAGLALVHWVVPASELARLLPSELELERYQGEAWLGAVACQASGLRARGLPPLPGLSSQSELELRTYVSDGVRSGLWLLSLEASNRVLVEAAKRHRRLPAFHASVELAAQADGLEVEAQRDGLRLALRLAATAATAAPPAAGSFEQFVCERYALYSADGGRLYRAELQCSPWRLRPARAVVEAATLVPVPLAATPRAHLAEPLDLVVWPPEEL
jgi:uncharacterized protein